MKKLLATLALVLTFGLFTGMSALAQENDSMTVVDEAAEPDNIALPEDAAPEARENAREGLNTANEAREKGREFGQKRAKEARERSEDARNRGSDASNRTEERQAGEGRNPR